MKVRVDLLVSRWDRDSRSSVWPVLAHASDETFLLHLSLFCQAFLSLKRAKAERARAALEWNRRMLVRQGNGPCTHSHTYSCTHSRATALTPSLANSPLLSLPLTLPALFPSSLQAVCSGSRRQTGSGANGWAPRPGRTSERPSSCGPWSTNARDSGEPSLGGGCWRGRAGGAYRP
jgi:hypothetical protein